MALLQHKVGDLLFVGRKKIRWKLLGFYFWSAVQLLLAEIRTPHIVREIFITQITFSSF